RRSFLLGTIAVAAAALLGSGPAMAEDAVLLASTAPGYAPGMVVGASARLSLPEGASATLLFRSGQMLQLRGPFEGSLEPAGAAGGGNSVARLVEVFRLQGVDATVIGGTRALGSFARSSREADLTV